MTVSSFQFQQTKKPYLVSSFVSVTDIKLSWKCSHHHQCGRVQSD